MRRGICRTVFTLLLFAQGGVLSSQPSSLLSLDQCIELGLKNSRVLHSSQMKSKAADARSGEVNAARLPSLKFIGTYTHLSDVPPGMITIPKDFIAPGIPAQSSSSILSPTILDNYNLRLSLQQPIFTGFRIQGSADMAEYAAKAASEESNADRTELVYNIRDAYWGLYKAGKFKNVVDENLEQVLVHLKDAINLMNEGMATTNDVLRVQLQVSNVRLLQIDADNNVQIAMIRLNNVLGVPLETRIELASEPDTMAIGLHVQELYEPAGLVQTAIKSRPEMKAMEYRVEASRSAVTVAKSGWFPQIYLLGNYYSSKPNPRIFPGLDVFKETWDVGVSATWDIWNWGSTMYQARQAYAQVEQASDALASLRDAVTLEVTRNVLNVRQSRERIRVSVEAVAQATENHRITGEKFKLGAALNAEMLDAESAVLQAKWNYIQALVDGELASARLAKSLGK